MSEFITPAIPAAQVVSVTSSVLPAGGNALDLIETVLTQNWRVPIGSVYQFSGPTAIGAFFGQNTTQEGIGSVYFNGFDNSNVKPGMQNWFRYAEDDVAAWLTGGPFILTLAQMQALSGTLSIVIDGVAKSGSPDLSSATSNSNAAQIIQDALSITGETGASITAAIGATFTGNSSGTNLTTTSVTGYIHTAADGSGIVTTVTGTGISGTVTLLSQTSGTQGGAGVYVTSASTTCSNASVTAKCTAIDVSDVASGTLGTGQLLAGSGVTADTYLGAQVSGTTGGIGIYLITISQEVASESMTTTWPAILFDSVSGAFVINSGTTGVGSTMAFATGTISAALNLTQATGAVLSQGAAATTPSAAMNAIIAITQNWVTFQTDWEPNDTEKEGFAAWASGQNGGTINRYGYLMWETSDLDVEQGGPSVPVAYINAGQLSGTVMIYQNPAITTLPGEKAAFMAGMVASIDYTEENGDATFAFKAQSGLLPDITNGNIAAILAGDPQQDGEYGYGINFYGTYTTANEAFIWWQRGLISGPYTWADDYFNQIWLNNQCQLALMVFLSSVKSVPYAAPGYAQVKATLLDPIQQAIDFGMIVPGTELSESQISQINTAAGNSQAAVTVQNQGYYLQIKPGIAQIRAARSSPPMTLWYSTGGSIQAMNLASVQAQ